MVGKKNLNSSAAVIEIGTNALRLKIAENTKQEIYVVDELYHPLSIGKDLFAFGKIDVDKTDKICSIIKGFSKVIKENGIENVKAFSTSALNEASNKLFVRDKIKIKTGFEVDIIDPLEEKTYIYQEMIRTLSENGIDLGSSLLVYIGSNNMGVAYYKGGVISFMQNFKLGSLRLTSLFEDIQDDVEDFSVIVEEYHSSFTQSIRKLLPSNRINHFVACGREIQLIAEICDIDNKDGLLIIPKESFNNHYEIIKYKSVQSLMDDYGLLEDKAELLFPAMSLYSAIFKFTEADAIISPVVFLRDAFLYKMMQPEKYRIKKEEFDRNTVESAKYMAMRYLCSMDHINLVTDFSIKIFDKLTKKHGLGNRERLLTETASILHDCGNFINLNDYSEQGYKIISSSDIIGLNSEEIKIIANVVSLQGKDILGITNESYSGLSENSRLVVSKIAAILMIADALDKSHMQKFEDIDVKSDRDELLITVNTYKDITLEEWEFNRRKALFEDVFGLKAIIKLKRDI